jgi:hypothetical protein
MLLLFAFESDAPACYNGAVSIYTIADTLARNLVGCDCSLARLGYRALRSETHQLQAVAAMPKRRAIRLYR